MPPPTPSTTVRSLKAVIGTILDQGAPFDTARRRPGRALPAARRRVARVPEVVALAAGAVVLRQHLAAAGAEAGRVGRDPAREGGAGGGVAAQARVLPVAGGALPDVAGRLHPVVLRAGDQPAGRMDLRPAVEGSAGLAGVEPHPGALVAADAEALQAVAGAAVGPVLAGRHRMGGGEI